MKLNLGCGFNKKEGFLNVDKFDTCKPDLVMDMEVTPWASLSSLKARGEDSDQCPASAS